MGDESAVRPTDAGGSDRDELTRLDRVLAEREGESRDGISQPMDATGSGVSSSELRDAVRAALAVDGTPPAVDADAMVARLRARLALDVLPSIGERRPLGRRQSMRRVGAALAWATAAAVMITASTHAPGDNIPSVQLGVDDTGSYHTGPGQRLRVQFSDGVELAAAPNTSVRVGRAGGYRALYVRGAAYIDAHDDSSRPLIVHAANAILENGGARFTVRTDPESREVRIAVASGVVLAGDSGAPLHEGHVLTRGTLGLVRPRGVTETFRLGDPDDAVMWEAAARRFAVDELPRAPEIPRP